MNIVAWGKLSCKVGNVRMMKLIAPSLPVLLKEQKLRRVQWKAWKQGIAQVNIVDSNCTTVPSFRDSRGVPAAVLWHGPLRPFIRRHVAGSVCERPAAHSVQQVEQWRGECLKSWALFFFNFFSYYFYICIRKYASYWGKCLRTQTMTNECFLFLFSVCGPCWGWCQNAGPTIHNHASLFYESRKH